MEVYGRRSGGEGEVRVGKWGMGEVEKRVAQGGDGK